MKLTPNSTAEDTEETEKIKYESYIAILNDSQTHISSLKKRETRIKVYATCYKSGKSKDAGLTFFKESDKVGGFGRFVRRAFPYRGILLQAIALNISIGLLSLASPFLTQILTDDVLVQGDTQLLTVVALGVIALNLFSNTIGVLQSFLLGYFGQRMQLGLQMEYGYKLLHLPLSYFESHRSGEVTSRLSDLTLPHLEGVGFLKTKPSPQYPINSIESAGSQAHRVCS